MATANFKTMKDFPLYVYNTEQFEDWLDCRLFAENVEEELEILNRELKFHEISLADGHYMGIQLLVSREHDLHEYEYDNDDCRYYFDCCRSVAHRNFDREIRKVNRMMKKIAKQFDFDELCVSAAFSNGEVWYGKVA